MRGIPIGTGAFIGMDVVLETSFPSLISIGNDVVIGMRCTLIGHFEGDVAAYGVPDRATLRLEDQVFLGPGVIVMPNVTIGHGSVVAAGSVVTRSVPAQRLVQGNPARVIATCTKPLGLRTPTWEFLRGVRKIEPEKQT
jgi:acetyltransferase-like isoleucine patch superfamily enzyme